MSLGIRSGRDQIVAAKVALGVAQHLRIPVGD